MPMPLVDPTQVQLSVHVDSAGAVTVTHPTESWPSDDIVECSIEPPASVQFVLVLAQGSQGTGLQASHVDTPDTIAWSGSNPSHTFSLTETTEDPIDKNVTTVIVGTNASKIIRIKVKPKSDLPDPDLRL